MGYKTDTRNDGGGSVYLRTKNRYHKQCGGRVVFTGRNLISVGIALLSNSWHIQGIRSGKTGVCTSVVSKNLQHADGHCGKHMLFPLNSFITRLKKKHLSWTTYLRLHNSWTEVKYNFAFFWSGSWFKLGSRVYRIPAADWKKDQTDAEYYKTMTRMCALLNGRTHEHLSIVWCTRRFGFTSVWLTNIGGKAITENVSTTLAARAADRYRSCCRWWRSCTTLPGKKIFIHTSVHQHSTFVPTGYPWYAWRKAGNRSWDRI